MGRVLKERIEFARGLKEVQLDPEAFALYERFYEDPALEQGGLIGEFMARFASNALRVSLLYSVLTHNQGVITRGDLLAGIGFLQYSKESTEYILRGFNLMPPVDSKPTNGQPPNPPKLFAAAFTDKALSDSSNFVPSPTNVKRYEPNDGALVGTDSFPNLWSEYV